MPHDEALLPHLRALLNAGGAEDAEIALVRVEDADTAEAERFLGSPTVRIDGQEVEPGAGQRTDFGLKCRLFTMPEGLRGIPVDEWVLRTLERARTDVAARPGAAVRDCAGQRRADAEGGAAPPPCSNSPLTTGSRDCWRKLDELGCKSGARAAVASADLLRMDGGRMLTFAARVGGCARRRHSRRRGWGESLLSALIGAAALTAGAPAAAPAAAVVGEWRFDELAGQAALDSGPHGLDGLLGATAEVDAGDPARIQGNSGNALRFDGASFVRMPDASELAPPTLTAEAVVRRAGSPGTWRYVISRGGQGCFSGSYGLYTGAAGGIAFYVFNGSYYVVSATARPEDVWDGGWHHVAGTFDGTGLRLWLDGRPIGAPSGGPTRIDYASSTTTTAIGRYFGTCDLPFTGDIDFVRLSSGAFSADAVQAATANELRPGLTTAPLPAAAPATRLNADQPDGGPRSVAPPAPKRACQLQLSRTRIAARRRATVRVRVILRGRSLRGVRVVAHRRATAKPIARARTGALGARLTFVMRQAGRLRVTAAISPRCSPRYIRVARKR